REAAASRGYGLVINARVDVCIADRGARPQIPLVEEAAARARAYHEAGADCVYPITLHEEDALAAFLGAVDGPVNVLAIPQAPPLPRLAELGVARVSYGPLVFRRTLERLAALLVELPGGASAT
ncbi:MAG: isocitrate lyase/phosphoenolpyruvate mutase family protein, partial [Actinobacteria bacterium]|nr:isocitrate lyase/phosphoenolpyruvate mutase family protein [Actinomycetota bacterium]